MSDASPLSLVQYQTGVSTTSDKASWDRLSPVCSLWALTIIVYLSTQTVGLFGSFPDMPVKYTLPWGPIVHSKTKRNTCIVPYPNRGAYCTCYHKLVM